MPMRNCPAPTQRYVVMRYTENTRPRNALGATPLSQLSITAKMPTSEKPVMKRNAIQTGGCESIA